MVALVANANLVAHRVAEGQIEAAESTLDQQTADFLGLDLRDVPAIVAKVQDAISQIVV